MSLLMLILLTHPTIIKRLIQVFKRTNDEKMTDFTGYLSNLDK
jgi:hypothetical protein